MWQVFGGNAAAGILDFDLHLVSDPTGAQSHSAILRRIGNGINQQVFERLRDFIPIDEDLQQWIVNIDLQLNTLAVGIIGLGNVGRQVARICGKGLDMPVLAYDPYLTEAEFQARGAMPVDLDTLLAQSDFVTIHCPFNAETKGMIGQRELALMQRDAFLITTARGGIVEEGALAAALETKQIAGAGVDVWNVEPPPLEHPLLTFDNVIATYHTAGVTVDSRHLMAQWNAEQVVQIFQGKRPPRLVNPEAWERFAQRFAEAFGFRPAA